MITIGLKRISYLLILFNFILANTHFAQDSNNLLSNKNRIAFGNYLFYEHDYLRAIDEFNSVLKMEWSDSLQFKVATSYYRMSMFDKSVLEFNKIITDVGLARSAQLERIRSFYQLGNYNKLRDKIKSYYLVMGESQKLSKLYNYSLLMDYSALPEKSIYLAPFNTEEKNKIAQFYNWESNPPYKSPTMAALMSAIIPGSGKVYANEIGDGITAFLLTGLFTYLAVDKFQNNHTASGWLYASIATFFYAGNVYGSATAVQNYNAGIKFNFDSEVKIFINERKQFLPTPKHLCN